MRCPSCGHENPDDAGFCGGCASSLASEITCEDCGRTNPAVESFCHGCGKPLKDSQPAATTPTPSPALPASFADGRYQVQRFLGEGGKKRVYLAHDSRLDSDVAIGVIKTEGLDAEGLTRVRREAQSMARLRDHPYIVTVHDRGDEGDQHYIVMEHMAGGSLDQRLEQAESHRLPLREAIRIADQVSQALGHAHDGEIIHRDLKPGNIYLTQDGTAKLGDFGFAVALDRSRLTQEGMMVGTASYMAPEQAVGGEVTPRSDLYALGCVLYEMVTGRPPFSGGDTVGVISQHINTAPIAPRMHNDELPQALDLLIMRLLAKAAEERPESASAVMEELRRIGELSSEQLAVQAPPSASGLDAMNWGQFVGRREEMDQLKSALEGVLSGQGALVMLVGEPGIGKTRLAEEFAVYASLRGAQVLTGHCYEGEVALPYRPFTEALRAYVHGRGDTELRGELGEGGPEVATLVSEIRQRLPDIPEAPPLEADAERLRLFESISAFVRNAAQATPLVLFLDDIHWADKPSLLMLRYLARAITGDRVLIVGAYRDIELDRTHPLAEVLVTLRREQPYQRVLLRGLPEEDVHGLLQALEPSEETAPARQALATALYQETEGNPLFIREVLSDLIEEGKLVREGGRWVGTVTSISELGIPEGVREVIGRRLSRLSEGCNQMLTLASTMTGGFDWAVIKELSDPDEAALFDLLDEAIVARVVRERSDGGQGAYEFTHATIRQTLYGELNIPRRVSLHRQIGETLERLHAANPEPHLSDLAHHFFQAAPGGDVEKAIDYAKRAGDRAVALLAYEEAAGQYELALQALDLKERPDEAQRCELHIALGETRWTTADAPRSLAAFQEAVQSARKRGASDQLARAALGVGHPLDAGSVNQALVDLLEETLHALPEDDSELRGRVLSRLARALTWSEEQERKASLSQQSVEMARRIGDKATLAFVLGDSHLALWEPGNLAERLAIASEVIRLAEEEGNRNLALSGHSLRTSDLLELGDVQEADREMEVCAQLVEELRQPNQQYIVDMRKAMRALLDGRFEEGETLAHQALRTGQEGPAAMQLFGVQISRVRGEQGRLDELEEMVKGFADRYPAVPAWRARLASIYSELDRSEDARREFERLAADDFVDIPRDGNWLVTVIYLAETCAFLGDVRRAAMLSELLLPYANRNILVGGGACNGSASRYLGSLAATAGRWGEAERHFDDALEMNVAMGARPLVARTQLLYAHMLLDSDGSSDRAKALELLTEALDTATELGMKSIVERTLALKMEIQGIASTDVKTSIDAVAAAVQSEQLDLSPHAAPDGTVTLLFSDIEDSTPLNERLGDQRWMDLLREHNALVREQLKAHQGYEVKTEGDGFMVAFSSARKALQCAIAIQRAFAGRNDGAEEAVRVRIGLHTGEPVKEGDDFYGKHVNLASRIGTEAQAGEILVSGLLRDLTESAGDIAFDEGREVELKGLGQQRVFQVGWE